MQFTQIEIPGLSSDEIGYSIANSEQCAAVRISRAQGCANHMFGITAHAFAVNADGTPTIDASGKTIEGSFTTSCSKLDLLVDGVLSLERIAEMKATATENALIAMLTVTMSEQAFDELGI